MFCAIDFGTSNSAIAVPDANVGMRLVELEPGQKTMPTAVFYFAEGPEHDGPPRAFGRAAIAAYVDGLDGRLMRSMKSVLGSSLIEQTTDVGGGRGAKYLDIVAGYLRHLKRRAEAEAEATIRQVVLGRPVFFVDDDPVRDAQAQAALEAAARQVGFAEIHFQYEPIAAAFDYERGADAEQIVLVADIGGGTSDFTVIRLGAAGARDVLASHGVHVAGTDFDRQVDLDAILPLLGLHGRTPEGREVPNRVYHDLATWHLINGVYTPRRVAELKAMRWFYADAVHHRRLMRVVEHRLGHRLMGLAEQAKIALSQHETAPIDLGDVEEELATDFDRERLGQSLEPSLHAIVAAARETVRRAGVDDDAVGALYFAGGSTGLRALSTRLSAAFPRAERVFGDRFASVASGLGIEAMARYGARA